MSIILATGAVDTSLDVFIGDDAGAGVTGLVAATFPDVYISKGTGADIGPIVLSDLSALTDAHSDGGVFERGGGYYRFDPPDTLSSTAAPKVTIRGEASGKHLIAPTVQVGYPTVTVKSGTGTGELNLSSGRIGINWGDILNKSSVTNLSGTMFATITSGVTVEAGGIVAASFAAGAIDAAALAADAGNKVADHVRRRTQANVKASSDGDALSLGSEYGAIQQMQNSSVSGGTMTVKDPDDVTIDTLPVTADASANPVTGVG